MYSLIYSKKAEKQLEKLDKEIRNRIIYSLERLKIRPEAYVEKLVGDLGYKFRVGNYRILVDIDKGKLIVLIIKIGHRINLYIKKTTQALQAESQEIISV